MDTFEGPFTYVTVTCALYGTSLLKVDVRASLTQSGGGAGVVF